MIVVVIPIYREVEDFYEMASIMRTLHMFRNTEKYTICLIHPNRLTRYVEDYFPGINVEIFCDKLFASIRSYNVLMLSKDFYLRFFKFDYVLICQSDVFISDAARLEEYLGYDYVGAPCSFGTSDLSVGNGGFSLRKTDSFFNALVDGNFFFPTEFLATGSVVKRLLKYAIRYLNFEKFFILKGFINEDYIFSEFLDPPFSVPSVTEAFGFSQDKVVDIDVQAIGYHGWRKNLSQTYQDKICKTLI